MSSLKNSYLQKNYIQNLVYSTIRSHKNYSYYTLQKELHNALPYELYKPFLSKTSQKLDKVSRKAKQTLTM